MNVFAKRMTMGFVLALLIAVLIGYGGMKRKVVHLYAEEFEQQSICAVFIQELKAFLGELQKTKAISFDTETTSINPMSAALVAE